ncbi:hypothetical protein ABC195_04510 [Microbacterium sp. 2P01SA-2]|uniref:hypothetical protein n=1 Tax=unclassified Microbacterium TaxID=2609290 RepID=UPI0039A3CEF6
MTDVSVHFDTLRSSATTIGAAGRAVRNSGELGYVSESVIGSNEVASVLQNVATEHSIRAEVASETLVTVGRRPEASASEFTHLDGVMAY